jgi:hypothetical protein
MSTRRGTASAAATLILLLTAAAAGTASGGHGQHTGGRVRQLENIGQLRAAFNAHPGVPRLIVLVSPTCPTCQIGASWVRQNVLNAHPHAKLSVLVLWEPMYPGDSYAGINPQMFNDPRVTSFWDPHEISGTWFDQHTPGAPPGWKVWDAYFAYAPSARWTTTPNHLLTDGHTIIATTTNLQHHFIPLLTTR